MKKLIVFSAIVLSFAATKIYAQPPGGGAGRGRMQEAWKSYLKDSVELSNALTDSVMAIRSQFQPQMREIFMDQSSSQDDKRAKMQALNTEMEARYKAAGLTDEQVLAIRTHEQNMRAQMRNRMGGGNN